MRSARRVSFCVGSRMPRKPARSAYLRKRKYAERAGFLGMRDPTQKETRRALRMQPVVQRAQIGGPLVALRVDDDDTAQGAMKLAAESRDERRMPPARFELAAVADGGAARKD